MQAGGWQVWVGDPIIDYLNGGKYPDCLALDCEIRDDIVAMTKWLREQDIPEGSLWLGPPSQILGYDGEPSGIQSFMGYRWFRIYWGFGDDLSGYPSPFHSKIIPLARAASMPPPGLTVDERSFA